VKRDAIPLSLPSGALELPFASAWRRALPALAVTLIAIVVAYASTALAMVETWYRSATFTHGFVVAPIAACLAGRKRAALAAIDPRPAPIVLPLLAVLGLAWLAGEFGAVNAMSQFAFVGMLVLAVIAVLGFDVARTVMFPLGFLFFAVPIGDFLLPTLMDRTADFTVAALRATGVPVYREGLLMVLPTGRWSVIEACSGVRYLIASLTIGSLFAYLNYRTVSRRLAFVALSIVVPIFANWVRAYLIVLLGHVSHNRLAVGVDHLIYGWIFFGVVMLVMFSIGARWREPVPEVTPAIAPRKSVPPVRASRFWVAVGAIVVLALVWPSVNLATQVPPGPALALQVTDPAGWRMASNDTQFAPQFDAPSASMQGSWQRGGDRAHLAIAYYRQQTPERKLVGADNVLVREHDPKWVRTTHHMREVTFGGTPHAVSETALHGANGRRLLVWQWYWIDGTVTASDTVAKARIGWLRLTRRRDDAAGIVLYAQDGDGHAAEETLRQFVADGWPAIESALQRGEVR